MRVNSQHHSVGYQIRLQEMIERSHQRLREGVRAQIGEFISSHEQRLNAVQVENNAEWMERALRSDR